MNRYAVFILGIGFGLLGGLFLGLSIADYYEKQCAQAHEQHQAYQAATTLSLLHQSNLKEAIRIQEHGLEMHLANIHDLQSMRINPFSFILSYYQHRNDVVPSGLFLAKKYLKEHPEMELSPDSKELLNQPGK